MLEWLPSSIRSVLLPMTSEFADKAEEIRIRIHRPLEIAYSGGYAYVAAGGGATREPALAYRPSKEDGLKLLDRITNHSLYTLEEELRRGYITVRGGHRIGLAGRVILEQGEVRSLKDISGFNIRIAREIPGAADKLIPYLREPHSAEYLHTLIISPPQRGKTTILRDIARIAASRLNANPGATHPAPADRPRKVGIVDERSEIAACIDGIPTFDIGSRTDVLDACPKAEGMMMMIRALSPEILIVDEIGRSEDTMAVLEAMHAGITVIATAHGRNLEDVKLRPTLAPLFAEKAFQRYVILQSTGATGQIVEVYDNGGKRIFAASERLLQGRKEA